MLTNRNVILYGFVFNYKLLFYNQLQKLFAKIANNDLLILFLHPKINRVDGYKI